MARALAVALGVVVVGLLATGAPWRADAADDARIAELEQRVLRLESVLYDAAPTTFACAEGEIVGLLTVAPRATDYEARLIWANTERPAGVDDPISDVIYGMGSAEFRDCS